MNAVYALSALVAVAATVMVITRRSAVHALLYLVVSLLAVAVIMLLLGAAFVAALEIIIYAGAIMVLFVFVIMLLGTERMRAQGALKWPEILAITAGIILVLEAVYVLFMRPTSLSSSAVNAAALPSGFGGPTSVGMALFEQYSLPFEITSVLLLVAMIGAIILSKRRRPART